MADPVLVEKIKVSVPNKDLECDLDWRTIQEELLNIATKKAIERATSKTPSQIFTHEFDGEKIVPCRWILHLERDKWVCDDGRVQDEDPRWTIEHPKVSLKAMRDIELPEDGLILPNLKDMF